MEKKKAKTFPRTVKLPKKLNEAIVKASLTATKKEKKIITPHSLMLEALNEKFLPTDISISNK